ncbi:MAG: hypothetical protein AB1744_02485 [Candidatus Zixiibacteriota bacterium]
MVLERYSSVRKLIGLAVLAILTAPPVLSRDRVLVGTKQPIKPVPGDNRIIQRGLTPERYAPESDQLQRNKPWSLPRQALAPNASVTIPCLVLRFNFQGEFPDDSNTTGNGLMNLSRPITDSASEEAYLDSVGHLVDPPPHDSVYFDAHLRALSRYWETVSEGKIALSWDIYPPKKDSVYELPHPMSHYGKCSFDSIVFGLEQFFIDCIQLADMESPEIDFSSYEAVFLFHAGSDRQNDLGFPPTCADLFSGFIQFGDSIAVDNGTHYVRTALLMPETSNQDNRATALNAVMAHEFGHQLGLVDLYSTATFMTQLGDFALMDNNGFGTGIDFDYPAGRVYGAIPLYPCAWSRAFLGYVDVVDFRQGDDVRVVAAEVVSQGIKVARVPISENEYYLIENRIIETDGQETAMLADSATYVFQGPVNRFTRQFTGEYDFLMPGSGLLIYHVDEGVAGLDYDGDSLVNFDDNDLQWDHERRFIRLIEADGLVGFGGYYRVGYGSEEDMFRDDRATSFTPNTNPPAIDNSGNNTHVFITNITRDTAVVGLIPTLLDSVMLFDVETDKLAEGFPVRAGFPAFGISPIADDLDGDGTAEIIAVADKHLLVFTTTGENFLCTQVQCDTVYYDRAFASVYPDTGRPHALPLYVRTAQTITTAPVTGDFGTGQFPRYVAIGFQWVSGVASGRVHLYGPIDNDNNSLADSVYSFDTWQTGFPIALSFGDILYVLTSEGVVYRLDSLGDVADSVGVVVAGGYHGLCRVGDRLIVLAGESSRTMIYCFNTTLTDSFSLGNHYYNFGPIVVDVNRDSLPEVVAFSPQGRGIFVTVDTTGVALSFSVLQDEETGFDVTTNPVAGDVDADGYPDIIIGGVNAVYAFNRELTLVTDFPVNPSDRYPNDDVVAAPVTADIQRGDVPEIIFPTFVGNVYALGPEPAYGFPVSAGEIITYLDSIGWIGGYFAAGSPVAFSDSTGGKLGYLGADGWFYAWDVDPDTITDYWPMAGHDPAGTFAFDQSKLSPPKVFAELLPKEKFYNYPNPVVGGSTRIRFFLGQEASRVEMRIFDLSGVEIAAMLCPTTGGIDHELPWDCSGVTPGVYRCVIEADFGGQIESIHTDIAVIR